MPRTTALPGCRCSDCRTQAAAAAAEREVRAYCDSCSTFNAVNACIICSMRLCVDCTANHLHSGPYCNDCGWSTLSGTTTSYCEPCDVFTCDNQHTYDHEDHEANVDGGEMPHVRGMGREASLDYIDIPYVYHELATGQRSVAVELEVEHLRDTGVTAITLPAACGVDTDGSLTNGVEITTPPTKGAKLVEYITKTTTKLSGAGFGVASTCGMHVHLDLRDKKEDTRFLSHLFNAFYTFEDILYAMQTYKRYNGHYSVPLRKQYKFFDMYGQKSGDFDWTFYGYSKDAANLRYMNGEKSRKYANVRYAAANFHSVYYRGSLEIRIDGGEIKAERALLWIDLMQAIVARVEQGHSYSFMTKWVSEDVTLDKLKAFKRYFKLSDRLYKYVVERVNAGQGVNFKMPHPVLWGTPVKGRPSRQPVATNSNSRVRCNTCSYEWLRYDERYCPNCDRSLFNTFGDPRYTVVRRRRRSTRVRDAMDVPPAVDWASIAPEQPVYNPSTFYGGVEYASPVDPGPPPDATEVPTDDGSFSWWMMYGDAGSASPSEATNEYRRRMLNASSTITNT